MNNANQDSSHTTGSTTVTVAAVHAAPVYLDLRASIDVAVELIEKAAGNGAKLIVFPEGFLPAHPTWPHFYPDSHPMATALKLRLFEQSLEIPSVETTKLLEACRDNDVVAVVGACERLPGSDGSMYNTQLVISGDGELLQVHRKLMPTMGERLVHTPGSGDTFGTVETSLGKISALICGENGNPLAIFALAAEYTEIHAMSWPPHFNQNVSNAADLVALRTRSFASMARCFVVSATAKLDETYIAAVDPDNTLDIMGNVDVNLPPVVSDPFGRVVKTTIVDDDDRLHYATLDLQMTTRGRLHQDIARDYNRLDVFRLTVDKTPTGPLASSSEFERMAEK